MRAGRDPPPRHRARSTGSPLNEARSGVPVQAQRWIPALYLHCTVMTKWPRASGRGQDFQCVSTAATSVDRRHRENGVAVACPTGTRVPRDAVELSISSWGGSADHHTQERVMSATLSLGGNPRIATCGGGSTEAGSGAAGGAQKPPRPATRREPQGHPPAYLAGPQDHRTQAVHRGN